jgi:hypothetical protein
MFVIGCGKPASILEIGMVTQYSDALRGGPADSAGRLRGVMVEIIQNVAALMGLIFVGWIIFLFIEAALGAVRDLLKKRY